MRYNSGKCISFVMRACVRACVCVCVGVWVCACVCVNHKIIKVSGAGMVDDGCNCKSLKLQCDPLAFQFQQTS